MRGRSYRTAFLAAVLAYIAYHLLRTDADLVLAHSSRRPDFWTGKVVLVTGASSGVGAALSVALASSGAKVILAARDHNRLHAVQKRCVGPDGTAAETRVMTMDASEPDEALNDFAARAVEQFGRLDAFFNNAGKSQRSPALHTSLAVHEELMRVDHFGPVALTLALLPELIQRGGSVVTTNSVSGKLGAPLRTSYSAAKHASKGFFEALRLDLLNAGTPVQVTNVILGSTRTQIASNALTLDSTGQPVQAGTDKNIATGMDPDRVAAQMLASCENALWEVWVVAPGVEKLALCTPLPAPVDHSALQFLTNACIVARGRCDAVRATADAAARVTREKARAAGNCGQ